LTAEQDHTIDVRIDGYTVRVGNRMYNLGHVVSTSVDAFPIGFVGGPLAAVWSKKWWLIVSFIFAVTSGVSLGARLIAIGILLGTVGWIVEILRGRAVGYRLTLETAFGADILESRDPEVMHRLADAIGEAINHPPSTVEQYIVHGDLVQQNGDGNVAVQVRK
jgi:uncharacterized membrane protein YjjB (DUF3815 family)